MAGAEITSAMTALWVPAVGLAAFTLLWLYLFVLPKVRYREFAGPPPTSWLFGNALEIPDGQFSMQLSEWARTYGSCFQVWLLQRRLIVVSDAEDVKHCLLQQRAPKSKAAYFALRNNFGVGLVGAQDDQHRRTRRVLAHRFDDVFVSRVHGHIARELRVACGILDRAAERGEPVDVADLFMRYVGDIMVPALFSRHLGLQEGKPSVLQTMEEILIQDRWTFVLYPLSRLIPQTRAHARAVRTVRDLCRSMLVDRQKSGTAPSKDGDLLDVLMAMDGADEEYIVSEISTFLLAALDTSSLTLTAALLELSGHPDVVDRLAAEAKSAIPSGGLLPEHGSVGDLEYAHCVWKETLRLHPPAGNGTYRCAHRDYKLPSGVLLPKDTDFVVSNYVIHRDPELWPDPLRFDPGRFRAESMARKSAYAFQPFSLGPRNCVGQFVANRIGVATLTALGARYRFELDDGDRADFIDYGDIVTKVVSAKDRRGPQIKVVAR